MSSLKRASKVSQAGELWEERQLSGIGQEEEAEEDYAQNAPASSFTPPPGPSIVRFVSEARRVVERRCLSAYRVSYAGVARSRSASTSFTAFVLILK